jgi:hypothetical protein
MADGIREIIEAEAKDFAEAFLADFEDDESFDLPESESEGEGHCQRGLSFVYGEGRWRKLVNDRGHHYFCHYGNGKFFRCGAKIYVAGI